MSAPSAPPEAIAYSPIDQVNQEQDHYYLTEQPLKAGQPPPFAPPHTSHLSSPSSDYSPQDFTDETVVDREVDDALLISRKAKTMRFYAVTLIVVGLIGLFSTLFRVSTFEVPIGILFGVVSLYAAQKRTLCWAKTNFYLYLIATILSVIAGVVLLTLSAVLMTCAQGDAGCGRSKFWSFMTIIGCFFLFPLICFVPCAVTGYTFMHAIDRRDNPDPPGSSIQLQMQMP